MTGCFGFFIFTQLRNRPVWAARWSRGRWSDQAADRTGVFFHSQGSSSLSRPCGVLAIRAKTSTAAPARPNQMGSRRAAVLVLEQNPPPGTCPQYRAAIGRNTAMRRIVLICAALIASLAMTISASARLGMAPLNAEDGSLIQIKGGHGHGHGHHGHRGGRGHHYGWGRGRGHHYGWYRGRGHRHW